MKIFKQRNKLIYKITLPLSLAVLLAFLVIIMVSRNYLIKTNTENTDEIIKSKVADLQKNIDQMGDKALYAASICASLDFVHQAYNGYYATHNMDSTSEIIRENIGDVNKSIEDNLHMKPKIHYHLPPAMSFIRCWSNKYGDDISDFRNTILQISKDHQPIKGIEVGRGGFVIRGIAPVFSEKDKYQGSVEVLLGLDNYLKSAKNRDDEEIAMFMHTSLLKIATGFLEASSSNVSQKDLTIGNFIIIDKTSPKFVSSELTSADLDKGAEGLYLLNKGHYKYGIYPIPDYSGKMIGVGVYQLDLSGFYDSLRAMNTAIIVVGVLALAVLILIIFWLIYRYVSKPAGEAMRFTEAIANGDLTQSIEVRSQDEIGVLLTHMSKMKDQLKDIVNNIMKGTDNIAAASDEISSGSQQLSQGANEQASSTEEASSSMEEMASSIQQNTENAEQTEQIASKAAEGIQHGYESTQTSVSAMKDIAEKIKIIDDIAFQTNILALNAAVEAARAGEYGKGFAVVAAEVRKLAERSKVAAGEISELSAAGVKVSEQAGTQLSELVPEIQKTAQLIQEIAATSVEQNSGAGQVNSAIQQLNNITQQNAAASEELATNSEELASQADQLKELVAYFRVGESKNNLKAFSTHKPAKKIITNPVEGANPKSAGKKAPLLDLGKPTVPDKDDDNWEYYS